MSGENQILKIYQTENEEEVHREDGVFVNNLPEQDKEVRT